MKREDTTIRILITGGTIDKEYDPLTGELTFPRSHLSHMLNQVRCKVRFINIAPENPVLWTGMKGASAESRKKASQIPKQVQHDMTVRFWSFCHPELVSGSRFWL